MKIRRTLRRTVATTTVVTLTSLAALVAPSRAATRVTAPNSGVGTTNSNQSVLSLQLGDLLGVNLLSDTGQAVTQNTTKALASIAGLQLTSKVIPALNVSVPSNPVVAQLPGGAAAASNQLSLGASLSGLLKGLPLLAGLGSVIDQSGLVSGGVLPLDVNAALANLTSNANGTARLLSSLGLLGGLASVSSLTSNLAQGSTTNAASVNRTLHVDAIGILNLGSLLGLLTGGNLLNLPLGLLTSLISGLGLPLPAIAGLPVGNLTSLVTGLVTTLTDLLNTATPLATLTAPVVGLLNTILAGTPLTSTNSLTGGIPGVTDLISTVLSTLTGLLNSVFGLLGNTPLLTLKALNLSAATSAVADVASSVASATCSLGSIQVGLLPAISLDAVNGVLGTVTQLINGIVNALPLGLNNLLQLSVCGHAILGNPLTTGSTHNVSQANGVVTSTAGTSAIGLGVHPEALLGAITGGGNPLSGLLGGLLGSSNTAAAMPALSRMNSQAAGLDTLLGGVTSVLSHGVSLDIGKVTAESTHTVLPQGTPTVIPPAAAPPAAIIPPRVTKLATTGGESTPFALGATVLLLLALTGRVLVRRTRVTADS